MSGVVPDCAVPPADGIWATHAALRCGRAAGRRQERGCCVGATAGARRLGESRTQELAGTRESIESQSSFTRLGTHGRLVTTGRLGAHWQRVPPFSSDRPCGCVLTSCVGAMLCLTHWLQVSFSCGAPPAAAAPNAHWGTCLHLVAISFTAAMSHHLSYWKLHRCNDALLRWCTDALLRWCTDALVHLMSSQWCACIRVQVHSSGL